MKPLLGGKGANLAEMTRNRFARAAGVHDYYRSLQLFLRPQPQLSAAAQGRSGIGPRAKVEKVRSAKDLETTNGRSRFRSFGRARFHARDDGHDPQPRNERRNVVGNRCAKNRQRAFRLGFAIAGFCRCMATSSWACRSAPGEDHEPFET